MTSMQDIADKAGVSRATISRVLSNHPSVKADTRKKVMYWIKKLNYEPNLIAQSLAGNSTNLIGVVVPEIAYPFFSEIIEAIEDHASYEGYSILIFNSHRSIEKKKNILSELRNRKVDGIIAVPVSVDQSLPAYRNISVPVTIITKKMEGFSSIYISHYAGGEQIARHFLNVGFQKIGYIGPTKSSTSAKKYLGLKNFLERNGVHLMDTIECDPPENMDTNKVSEIVKRYITDFGLNSEVFLANDDMTACEAISSFREMGYSIPKDVAIAGFDNSLLAKAVTPKLTSLAQPIQEIGKKAVEVLLEQIHNHSEPKMYEMETRVIARESTMNWNAN